MFQVTVYSLCGIGTAEFQVTKKSVCEGGIAGLEAKALVRMWNSGTSSRSTFLMWKRNYGTSKHYSLSGSGMSDLKVTQHSMCGSGTAGLKVSVQWRQNIKYRMCTWYVHEVHAVCKGLIVNKCTCGAHHVHKGVTLSSVCSVYS